MVSSLEPRAFFTLSYCCRLHVCGILLSNTFMYFPFVILFRELYMVVVSEPEQAGCLRRVWRRAPPKLSSNDVEPGRLLYTQHPWPPGSPLALSGHLVCTNCLSYTWRHRIYAVSSVRPQAVAAVPRVLAAYVPRTTTSGMSLTSRNTFGVVHDA